MPKDFYVDQATGDFYPDRMVTGIDFTQQSLWISLSLWLGDWFLNNAKGMDWELVLSHQPPRLGEFYAGLRRIALSVHGITEVLSMTPEIVGRKLTVYVVCATIYGVNATFNGSFGQ